MLMSAELNGVCHGAYMFFELFLGKMMLTPQIFNHLLICVNLCHHAKNLLIPLVHSRDAVSFGV